MEIDDGNTSFNSLYYNDITIISLENTASEKVPLSSKNEICKNKDSNRVINNSDFVYEDESEKILLHNININCKNMNEQTEDDNNLKTRKRTSAKMQNMGSDEFIKLHEKEALRKKPTYWKNKKENSNKLEVIKIKRKTRKIEQMKNMNNDKLRKER